MSIRDDCCLSGNPGYYEFPINHILQNVGLDSRVFDGKVLDIGCGRQARLVRRMREIGVPAEGLDPLVEIEAPYLFKTTADKIPRPDCHYDFAYSHSSVFRDGSTRIDGSLDRLTKVRLSFDEQLRCLAEITRVLKPGANLAIYPSPRNFLRRLEEYQMVRHFAVHEEPVSLEMSDSEKLLTRMVYSGMNHEAMTRRAVLTKPRTYAYRT